MASKEYLRARAPFRATPFATPLLSKHIGTANQPIAVTVYAVNFFFMGLSMACLWNYASWRGLARSSSSGLVKMANHFYWLAVILPGAVLVLSLIDARVCLVMRGGRGQTPG